MNGSARPEPVSTREPLDTTTLVEELSHRQAAGQRWVYLSQQAPFWVRLMMLIPVVVLAYLVITPPPPELFGWVIVLLFLGVAVPLLMGGGLRTQVTSAGLVLRIGWGPRLLRFSPSEIVEAEACEFNPVGDFGGWGIKLGRLGGRWVWGFNLEGNTGVLVRTRKDRRFLIGTSEPERLVAVLNVARGLAAA